MFKKTIFQNTVNKHRTQNTDTEHRTQTQLISGLGAVSFLFLTYVAFNVLHLRLEMRVEIFQATPGKWI